MGEEEKKPEEKKVEDKQVEEKKEGEVKKPEEEKKEKKEEKAEVVKESEIVLRVYMHCEGCAKKVKRSLRGFEGVESVETDSKTHKVVVKGKNADPLKVKARVERKSHRKVELLSPIPKPPPDDGKKAEEDKEKPKPEEKKEPPIIIVVLKVYMHCEACAQEIRKRIQKMKGVISADPDLKSALVTVKGTMDPTNLVEYVYKRTGKQAVILKQEPEKKEKGKGKEEKEEKKGEKKEGEGEKEKKEGDEGKGGEEQTKATTELKTNEFYYYPKYDTEYVYPQNVYPQSVYPQNVYPPQIFSDENPNACSVM